jgi:hypothetical protein
MTSQACLIILAYLSNHIFELEAVSYSSGSSVASVTFIIPPPQVMISTTDTISLVFSAKSRLKCLQNILHLCSLIRVSNFENSTVLRCMNSPVLIRGPHVNQILLLCEIPGPEFPHFHPMIVFKRSTGVYYEGIHCYLLYVLILIGNL